MRQRIQGYNWRWVWQRWKGTWLQGFFPSNPKLCKYVGSRSRRKSLNKGTVSTNRRSEGSFLTLLPLSALKTLGVSLLMVSFLDRMVTIAHSSLCYSSYSYAIAFQRPCPCEPEWSSDETRWCCIKNIYVWQQRRRYYNVRVRHFSIWRSALHFPQTIIGFSRSKDQPCHTSFAK